MLFRWLPYFNTMNVSWTHYPSWLTQKNIILIFCILRFFFYSYSYSILQSAVEIGSEKFKYFSDQNGPQDRLLENKLGLLSSTKTFVCSNWKGKKSSILVLCFVSWEARKTYILKEGAYLLISQLFNSDMTHQSTQLWWYCNWIFLLFLETFIALFVFCALIVLTLKRNLVSWKYCGHLNKEIISFFPSWFCVVCVTRFLQSFSY